MLGWLGKNTTVVIVGDGAKWIWNRAEMFPNRCEILDFWHAAEHAWATARILYGEHSRKTPQWATAIVDSLRAGKIDDVIAMLQRIRPKRSSRGHQLLCEEAVADLLSYDSDNRTRMRYHEYLAKGYGIGSGAIESAHKQLTHARMRQAGMRWSEAGARNLLALRVLLLNRECDTQVDPRLINDVTDVSDLSCWPVAGASTPARRAGARGPGIELPGRNIPTSLELFR